MTSYSTLHWGGQIWVVLVSVVVNWTTASVRAADSWPDSGPSRRLTDNEPSQGAASARSANFRMTDRGHKSAYPRVPGVLLSELTDAALPSSAAGTTAKPNKDPTAVSARSPRALPPVGVDPNSIAAPDGGGAELAGTCPACKTCGSLDANPAQEQSKSCDSCTKMGSAGVCLGPPDHEGWFQNSIVFIAGDGWKNIFDDDDNNNFGLRTGFNMGIDLPGRRALRGQFGMSYGAYDFHGREGILSRDDPIEQQVFATAGVYKPSMVECGDPLAWGIVYDAMYSLHAGERADAITLGQLRGYVGFAVNERNEFGTWVASRMMRDFAPHQRVQVNATDQINLFWHHTWQLGGDTTAYVGWADDPGNVTLGLSGRVPLNNHVALFGNVHYIIPSTTGGDVHPVLRTDDVFNQESWNVSFGIVLYRGRKAVSRTVSGTFGLPLLPVADNGSFSFQADML